MSDILDGFIARKLEQQSAIGAKLDSISDFIFTLAILVVVLKNIYLPLYLWWYIIPLAFLRLVSYSIGFYKYHTFSSLHTLLNKITGVTIFAFLLFYRYIGFNIVSSMICIIAFLSSVEEMVIIIKSKELNRDVRSIFTLYKNQNILKETK